ncbi:GTP-binding protein RHO4 [Entamoeba marina]
MKPIKILAVGDDNVGKIELLTTFGKGEYPQEYVPTTFDNCIKTYRFQNKEVKLDLWDLSGFGEYSTLRKSFYYSVDVILLCFKVNNEKSFNNIKNKWYPEIAHKCPSIPILLVGTHSEKRSTTNQKNAKRLVNKQKAMDFASQIGAKCYIECSALNYTNVELIFDEAIGSVMPNAVESVNVVSYNHNEFFWYLCALLTAYTVFVVIAFIGGSN